MVYPDIMQVEADYSAVSSHIRNQTYDQILAYARQNKIFQKVTTGTTDGHKKTIEIPNISESVRKILEQFFKEHPV